MSRQTALAISVATLLALPSAGHAQVWVGPRISTGVACDQAESALVNLYVHKRNEGQPVETLLAMYSSLPDGDSAKAVAASRAFDVYLDKALDVPTIRSYRTAKCARQLLTHDYRPQSELARARLIACQTTGTPGDRKFSKCIHTLLDELEHERQRVNSGD
ncbi:hypothetical protein ACFFGH_34335 [Lysobacter korlensis]|uniref:Uncharacterized protein n=1 Tax=Lysobacter korlensis TaxID=553636 RepID=A0ABV6S123_9GAMM